MSKIKIQSICLVFIVSFLTLKAQENTFNKSISPYTSNFNLGGTFSFVGYSVFLTYGYNYHRSQFYIGPKTVLSRAYLFYTGPIGFKLGWKYLVASNDVLKAYINIDYQNAFNKAYNPKSVFADKLNKVHEVFFNNSIEIRLSDRLWLGETIGIGIYEEELNNLRYKVKQTNFGYNLYLGIHLSYGIGTKK